MDLAGARHLIIEALLLGLRIGRPNQINLHCNKRSICGRYGRVLKCVILKEVLCTMKNLVIVRHVQLTAAESYWRNVGTRAM